MKNKIITLLCLFLGIILVSPKITEAAGTPKLDFTYYVVQPSTQLDTNVEYYYIQTKPGENQKIEMELTNTSEKEVEVAIVIKNAISTESGQFDYGIPLIEDNTLKNPISEIVIPEEKTVTLKAFEKKMIALDVKPPTEHYDGVKIGAIYLTSQDSEKIDDIVSVESGYRIAVITSENGDEFNDGSTLDLIDVKPTLVDGRKVIQAAVQNPEPKGVENVDINAKLIDRKSKEVVKDSKVKNYTFAPNSTLPFIFDWGLSNLEGGDYTLIMNAKNHEHEWNMERNFSITDKEAKKLNDESPFRIVTPVWMKLTAVALGLLVIVISIILLLRNKKWQKEIIKSKKRKSRRRTKK